MHLHEEQNLLSSLDLAISMLFFPLWIFSQLTRHVPGSQMTKYLHDSDCREMQRARHKCAEAEEKSALPCRPLELTQGSKGSDSTQPAKHSSRPRASCSEEGVRAEPSPALPWQPPHHVDQLMGSVNPRGKGWQWKGTSRCIFPSVGLLSRSDCRNHGKCICLSAQHAP